MAGNFDNVDVSDFGYGLNDNATVAEIEQAVGSVLSAYRRAEQDKKMREAVLRAQGNGYFGNDDEWGRLMAKAQRLGDLCFALNQKAIMEKAKAKSGRTSLTEYQVTEVAVGHKKDAADAALASWNAASVNAADVGPDLPDVKAYVDHLAQQAALLRCQHNMAVQQLAYNGVRARLVTRYDLLMASARNICAARTEGEKRLLGISLQTSTADFKKEAEAFNAARDQIIAANATLAAASATGAEPVTASTSAHTSAVNLRAAALPSSDASDSGSSVNSTSASGVPASVDRQLEPLPYFSSAGADRNDYWQSTSSARRAFEALLTDVYGASSSAQEAPGTSAMAQGSAMQAVSASRLSTTTTTTTHRLGRWTVTETSVVQVQEHFAAVRLSQLTISWEAVFGSSRAGRRQMALPACVESGDQDGIEESIVLHSCLVRPEVTAIHVRLLLAYLGYPTVAWVKRGFSERRGPREDCAWIKFRSLEDAIDCKWRWDGMGHWGLTPWDERLDQPRPLHFSFSTHPAYKGKKQ